MTRLAHGLILFLTMLVTFTGQQTAVARGAMLAGADMVLCVGGITVQLSGTQEDGAAHVCPDGLLTFAILPGPVAAPPVLLSSSALWSLPVAGTGVAIRPLLLPPARGPPAV